jgi:hypothetical protein
MTTYPRSPPPIRGEADRRSRVTRDSGPLATEYDPLALAGCLPRMVLLTLREDHGAVRESGRYKIRPSARSKNLYLDRTPFTHAELREQVIEKQTDRLIERDIWKRPTSPDRRWPG